MTKEFSYELGNIIFKDENKAKSEMRAWYESNKEDKDFSLQSITNKTPETVEFDLDIETEESSSDNGTLSDEFPSSLLEETKTVYNVLQNENIADLSAPKTKTQLVYEYKE